MDARFGVVAELVAGVAGWKKTDGTPLLAHDFYPSTRPAGLPIDPPVDDLRGANVVDLPVREGETDVERGLDRWVEMCRSFARARGG